MSPGKYVLGNQWSWNYSVFERKKYTMRRLCVTATLSLLSAETPPLGLTDLNECVVQLFFYEVLKNVDWGKCE